MDESDAIVEGIWRASTFESDFVGTHYIHDDRSGKGKKSVRWEFEIPKTGRYEVRLSYTDSASRDSQIPVTITESDEVKLVHMNQQATPSHPGGFTTIGFFDFSAGKQNTITISNKGTKGHVTADALQILYAAAP